MSLGLAAGRSAHGTSWAIGETEGGASTRSRRTARRPISSAIATASNSVKLYAAAQEYFAEVEAAAVKSDSRWRI
jgi:hypothetical protein